MQRLLRCVTAVPGCDRPTVGYMMRKTLSLMAALFFLTGGQAGADAPGPVSEATAACMACHSTATPGVLSDWKKGVHAMTTPAAAVKKPTLSRKMSADDVPSVPAAKVVGCAECHTLNPDRHKDTFRHNGYNVHTVVTPEDCAVCHPVEHRQYGQNIMSAAYGNLMNNSVYHGLVDAVNGTQLFHGDKTSLYPPDPETNLDSCIYCHGSVVEVKGTASRLTGMGEMKFPVLSGWPNQGVGRVNPDGSKGSCAACHTRHQFAIEMARKPYTCAECHKGPDVPAYKVYEVSKHGNIYASLGKGWDFKAVPWTVGKDFTAPTCAGCHVSLMVTESAEVVAERTHQMNERNPWRLFGLVYAHPHPLSPDTTPIRNKAGLPLPTELTGEPAAEFLIDAKEQGQRQRAMQAVCLACHSQGWVDGHYARLENAVKTTNEMTLTATKILLAAWESGAAKGPAQNDGIFNEALEKKWVEEWLFFANSTRFASAMAGADYGAFANGRWYMSKNIQDMLDWLKLKAEKK